MTSEEIKNKINRLKLTRGNTSAYTTFDKMYYTTLRNIVFSLNSVTEKAYMMKDFDDKIRVYRLK